MRTWLTTAAVFSAVAEGSSGDPRDLPGLSLITLDGGAFTMGTNIETAVTENANYPEASVTLSGFALMDKQVTNEQFAAFLQAADALDMVYVADAPTASGAEAGYPAVFQAYATDDKRAVWNDSMWQVNAPGDLHGEDAVNEAYVGYDEAQGGFYLEDWSKADWPAIFIRWYGADAFCNFYGLQLPTEAQWEFAAQGGQGYDYGTDDGTISSANCNYDNHVGHAMPVGSYPANPFGFFDLCGNAWEWTRDNWNETSYERWDGETDPVRDEIVELPDGGTYTGGPGQAYSHYEGTRVTRGGAYNYHDTACGARYRRGEYPFRGNDHFGFRCAAALAAPSAVRGAAAVAGAGQLFVSWEAAWDNGAAVTEYTVAGAASGTVTTTQTWALVEASAETTFTISAANLKGSGAAVSTAAVTPLDGAAVAAPFPPRDVAVLNTTYGEATVNWTAPVADNHAALTGYVVYAVSEDGWSSEAVSAMPAVLQLDGGASYVFGVAAVNSAGQSVAANVTRGVWVPVGSDSADDDSDSADDVLGAAPAQAVVSVWAALVVVLAMASSASA